MPSIINDVALDILFRSARNNHVWLDRPVSDTILRAIWELVRLGPAAPERPPARVVFAKSRDSKQRIAAGFPASSRAAALATPVIAVIGSPHELVDPVLDAAAEEALGLSVEAVGSFYGAYLILAARALGLDCEPLWQFDRAAVDAALFPGPAMRANFVGLLGYADNAGAARPAAPRDVAEACQIL